MKKIVKEEDKNTSELWFNWLTRKLNSYEAFKDFASGQNPEDVAENFLAINSLGISDIFDKLEKILLTLQQYQVLQLLIKVMMGNRKKVLKAFAL